MWEFIKSLFIRHAVTSLEDWLLEELEELLEEIVSEDVAENVVDAIGALYEGHTAGFVAQYLVDIAEYFGEESPIDAGMLSDVATLVLHAC